MAGTHADVRRIVPEGLSIGVDDMPRHRGPPHAARVPVGGRSWSSKMPTGLTEGAANALLKVVEEPRRRRCSALCPRWTRRTSPSRCGPAVGIVALATRRPRRSPASRWTATDWGGRGHVGGRRQRWPRRPGQATGHRPGGAGAPYQALALAATPQLRRGPMRPSRNWWRRPTRRRSR